MPFEKLTCDRVSLSEPYKIQCLVPDLPEPRDVMPYLEEMHAARWYSNFGPLNSRFETAMKSFINEGASGPDVDVVTFTSATTALEAALRTIGLREGARVLIPTLTFPATATAVINAGFTPVLSDVDADSWELLPHHARMMMESQTIDAVMPVSTYGKPIPTADWDRFMQETGVPVIADTAAALGQQPAGEHIHLAFSLHATKPFSIGEGGLLVTPDGDLAKRARSWSNFGFSGPGGVISQIGTNAKLGEYYAATGLAQIERWSQIKARRQAVLDAYREALAPLDNRIKWQSSEEPFIPATFVIHASGQAQHIASAMMGAGIHTRFWYLPPLYEHPALEGIAAGIDVKTAFPVTEELKHSLIGLPFHSFLSRRDVENITTTLAKIL